MDCCKIFKIAIGYINYALLCNSVHVNAFLVKQDMHTAALLYSIWMTNFIRYYESKSHFMQISLR